jgi:hypothetical protein
VSVEDFRRSIQLFTPRGRIEGAEAAFEVLARAPRLRGWLWSYRHLPFFASLTEALYRVTARHRGPIYRLARPLFGARLRPARYVRTSSWLTRGIGLSALCAFLSWWSQAAGLIGADGILPVARYFDIAAAQLGPFGWLQLPTLYWLSSEDWMTTVLCAAGVLAALGLLFRIRPAIAAFIGFVCYLSLDYGGQVFLQYQWDALLVESLFLAMLLNLRPRTGIWLARLLVFRFMLLSGAVKLLSGDPSWRALTALDFHFETQPLPTIVAWYAHQLPQPVLHAGVAATLFIELVLPWLIFMPRNLRLVAAAGFVGLEVLIIVTGNYNFFNLLTLALCLALLDDRAPGKTSLRPQRQASSPVWRVVLVVMAMLGALQIHATLSRKTLTSWEIGVLRVVQPWQLVNRYGLFSVMTTQRNELIVEGSADGRTWREVPFPFKPQALDAPPRWATPHQPRLDWQMWFAALTTPRGARWIEDFLTQLLLGSPSVAALLAAPFADEPPRFVRVLLYRYDFTSFAERDVSGDWWRREYLGIWYPSTRLREFSAGSGIDP